MPHPDITPGVEGYCTPLRTPPLASGDAGPLLFLTLKYNDNRIVLKRVIT